MKNIIVTGGCSGIGYAIARKIAEEGYTVILIENDIYDLIKANTQLNIITKKEHFNISANINDKIDIINIKNYLEKNFKEINGLINCINTDTSFFESIDDKLIGITNICQMFENLKSDSNRKIINILVNNTEKSIFNYSNFENIKIKISTITEKLSEELVKKNIKVDNINLNFDQDIFLIQKEAIDKVLSDISNS